MARRQARSPREVFLSHASADRATADALVQTLRAHGVPVWYSTTNIQGAQQWHDEIGRALRRCDWYVLLLSPASVESVWVKRELLFALGDSRYEERIVPLVATSCDPSRLSWTLDSLQQIDLRRRYAGGCRDLLHVWGVGCDRKLVTIPRVRPRRRIR